MNETQSNDTRDQNERGQCDSSNHPATRKLDGTTQPMVDYDDIARGSNMVLIRFEGAIYSLKKTRNRRLVLHK